MPGTLALTITGGWPPAPPAPADSVATRGDPVARFSRENGSPSAGLFLTRATQQRGELVL